MYLQLQLCTSNDTKKLLSISRQTFIDAFEDANKPEDFAHYMNTAFSEETILQELLNPHASFYFVNQKNHTVAYFKLNDHKAQTDVHDKDAFELERIYVLSAYQGLGIGHWVIEQVSALAKKAQKKYIWLGVWEKNVSAIQFYEKKGFVKFGRHPYYIGQDKQMDWLMRLDLSTL